MKKLTKMLGAMLTGALLSPSVAIAQYDDYDYYDGLYESGWGNDDWFYDYYEYDADANDGYYDYYDYYDYDTDLFDWEEDGLF